MRDLDPYQQAIVRNAEWFLGRQREEGYIDADGDEFYGVRGDATLVGHSASVRLYAYALTQDTRFLDSARRSLEWLTARQDKNGGWKGHSAFTLDGAQCVFEGFNTYRQLLQDTRFDAILIRAADRMAAGALDRDGRLKLPNIIEIGEYAHFAMLAYKTTGFPRFRAASERILMHILTNFDDAEGYWCPYDRHHVEHAGARVTRMLAGPILRAVTRRLGPRGRLAARVADHLLPFVTIRSRPQYALSLMDTELLIDTLDGSCAFPELYAQAVRAVRWATRHCAGPFPGSLVESRPTPARDHVYPVEILNDSTTAATWPTACLLIAYCGLRAESLRAPAAQVADYLRSVQDARGGFFNFQNTDGTFRPLQSGNVNFYVSMALWLFGEVYGGGPWLITRPSAHPPDGHSSRSASTAGIRAARSAGSSDAASTVASEMAAAISSVRGSPGAMP